MTALEAKLEAIRESTIGADLTDLPDLTTLITSAEIATRIGPELSGLTKTSREFHQAAIAERAKGYGPGFIKVKEDDADDWVRLFMEPDECDRLEEIREGTQRASNAHQAYVKGLPAKLDAALVAAWPVIQAQLTEERARLVPQTEDDSRAIAQVAADRIAVIDIAASNALKILVAAT